MLGLGEDIIAHHLLPQLPLKDLLSLRQTCKSIQANIDANEWDRRYFQEFPFDTVRLAGRGMDRYVKRYFAKARHMGDINRAGGWTADEAYDKSLKYFETAPIVDFDLFDIETACGEFDFGAAVRSLEGDILIHTESGADAVLSIDGLSGVHLCDEELIAWKRDVPVKSNLTLAFWLDEFDENDEPIPREPGTENLVMEVDTESPASDEVFKLLDGPQNSQGTPGLFVSEPWLKYLQYRRMYHESVRLEPKVLSLIEQSPGCLETLWFCFVDRPTYVVAGSSGSTLSVVFGGDDYKMPKTYQFPHPIVKIGGARYSFKEVHICDINILDCNGSLHCLRFTGKQVSETEWQYPLLTVEPFVALENVADLAERSALMKDGTIRCFLGPAQSWLQVQAKGAVLITYSAYLTTEP